MSTMKILGAVAAGFSVAALIGGGILWAYRRRKKKEQQGKTPERVTPSAPPRPEQPSRHSPTGVLMDRSALPPALKEALDKMFPGAWPPDDETVNSMETGHVVVFAAESEPAGPYENTRQELISAKVLSVEKTHVRARIIGEVRHAEHHGSHAGHGFRQGDLVEVPRSKILVAAQQGEPEREGYNSEGRPMQTFKPSDQTKKTYKVRPDTPYDLQLPYRTEELEWHVDGEHVEMIKIGERGLLEQIKFSEATMRGTVTVRAIDNDPKEGYVHVGRWQFEIAA